MGRSRSRSPSRRRSHSRGGRSQPRDSHGDRDSGPLSVLVRNLDYASSPDTVRDVFKALGEIQDVYLPLEYGSRKPKGFGFVKYRFAADAHAAVERLDNTQLDGKTINVIVAQDRRKSPSTMKDTGDRRYRGREWEEPRDHWAKNIPIRERSRSRSRRKTRRSPSRDNRRKADSRRRSR